MTSEFVDINTGSQDMILQIINAKFAKVRSYGQSELLSNSVPKNPN